MQVLMPEGGVDVVSFQLAGDGGSTVPRVSLL